MPDKKKERERKDSGLSYGPELGKNHIPRDHQVPIAPSAASQKATGVIRTSTIPNIDAIIEHPPRRRSSIMATGIPTIVDLAKIGKIVDTEDTKERESRFISKCRGCCGVFDMSDPTKDQVGKELKRIALQELIDAVRSQRGLLSELLYPEVIHLVAVNGFRSLPPLNPNIIPEFDPVAEAEEPTLEVAWPHLQLVYNVFLSVLESPEFNANVAVKYIDHTFVLQLLQLFDSEDPRERDILKAIVHRMYGKFLMLRTYIRKQFNHIFFGVIYEVGRHHGLAEMLEILGSIINGFAIPLRDEHRQFLFKVLLPLHKIAGLVQFHPQLAYCTVQYLEKEPTLTTDLLKQFLRLWPKTDGSKEVMFLNELEEILDVVDPGHFQSIMVPVFRQVAQSASSLHFQTSERALLFFSNSYILGMMKNHSPVLFPILYPVLYKITTGHWNRSIHSWAYHALKVMMEMDQRTFDMCIQHHSAKATEEREMTEKRRHFALMLKIHKKAEASPNYPYLVGELLIRPPNFEDYLDRRNVSMKYENWRVTTDEIKARETQTQMLRPVVDKSDVLGVRRRSDATATAGPMASMSLPLPVIIVPKQFSVLSTVKSVSNGVETAVAVPANGGVKSGVVGQGQPIGTVSSSTDNRNGRSGFGLLRRSSSSDKDKTKKPCSSVFGCSMVMRFLSSSWS